MSAKEKSKEEIIEEEAWEDSEDELLELEDENGDIDEEGLDEELGEEEPEAEDGLEEDEELEEGFEEDDGLEDEEYDDEDYEEEIDEEEEDEFDFGITKEGVAEATGDLNEIYKDGVAVAKELKDAFDDIKSAFNLGGLFK